VFASGSFARALAAGLPCQNNVSITTDESFRFHNNNIEELRGKLDATENPCPFEKYPTPPDVINWVLTTHVLGSVLAGAFDDPWSIFLFPRTEVRILQFAK